MTDFEDLAFVAKITLSIIWDVLDFTIGRIPILGTIFDLVSVYFCYKLWGIIGLISFWEVVLDPTDNLDAFVPTMTIVGILSYISTEGDE